VKVLITGANGQVGSELVSRFAVNGNHDVIATTRENLDLGDRDSVMSAITTLHPDAVVHAGAYTAVDACESEQDTAYRINALGTRHVADAARRVGAPVCYLSTDYVFDGTLDRPYNEWDAPNPASVYGRSKLGGEMELNDGDTIVRTSWIFGRHGANMVKTVLRLLGSHPQLSFVDDQHGKPTCAEDLAAAVYALVTSRLTGTYHVTNEGATTWFGFVRDVVAAAGEDPERVRPISTDELVPPRPAPRPENSVLDNAAWRLTGLPPLAHYREPLERVVKELRDA